MSWKDLSKTLWSSCLDSWQGVCFCFCLFFFWTFVFESKCNSSCVTHEAQGLSGAHNILQLSYTLKFDQWCNLPPCSTIKMRLIFGFNFVLFLFNTIFYLYFKTTSWMCIKCSETCREGKGRSVCECVWTLACVLMFLAGGSEAGR